MADSKPRPIELCLERIQTPSAERYVRCTAQVGRELGLGLGIDGRILWCEQSGVGCEICVSADQRLMAYCPTATPPTVLYRAGRVLELPKQRPVVLRHHDELELAGTRFRVHVHGATDRVHAPAVVRTLVRAAAAASLALTVGGAAGCGESGSGRDAAQADAGQSTSDVSEVTVPTSDADAQESGDALIDVLDFLPADVDEIAMYLPSLRRLLPPGTRIGLGLAFSGGREAGTHVFPSRAALESALDRIALETGEAIVAPSRAPVTTRREACVCALGQTLNVRSDGLLYPCFRMHEPAGDLRQHSFTAVAANLQAHPRPAREFLPCADCPLATLCGGGCRSDNFLLSGDSERPVCGPWRVQVLSELLAEDRVSCLEWPTNQLANEARLRGIEVSL